MNQVNFLHLSFKVAGLTLVMLTCIIMGTMASLLPAANPSAILAPRCHV